MKLRRRPKRFRKFIRRKPKKYRSTKKRKSHKTIPHKHHIMKLDLALVGCDLNPRYINFWPLVHRAWKEIVGIRIILILIADKIPDDLPHKNDIILFPPIPGMHTAFQAQCIRILYPALLGHLTHKGIILTDMDMIPMSREYFYDSVLKYNRDTFITFYGPETDLYICYNIATPAIWNAIFQVNTLDNLRHILNSWYNTDYEGKHGTAGWCTDQVRLFNYVMKWRANGGKLIRLNKAPRRLCRDSNTPEVDKIKHKNANNYDDFHMNYPYEKYKDYLEKIYSLVKKV